MYLISENWKYELSAAKVDKYFINPDNKNAERIFSVSNWWLVWIYNWNDDGFAVVRQYKWFAFEILYVT